MRVLVAGGGGFIGGHLVSRLLEDGHDVLVVDIKDKSEWFQVQPDATNLVADLSLKEKAFEVVNGVDWVLNLAADMGGMGFIENNKSLCMLSSLINTHLLMAAREYSVSKYFFASSACVYSSWHQNTADLSVQLRESDAYPADPEDGYGWEKLFSERMCRHFMEDFGLPVYVGRFHNVYGPFGTFQGGREKAPASACRKVVEYSLGEIETVEIWGDGEQLRSFTYVDDCVEGVMRLLASDFHDPLNIGSDQTVSIRQLYDLAAQICGIEEITFSYDLEAPQGVRGRSSNNELCTSVLNWSPSISLLDGLTTTFRWIEDEILKSRSSQKG